MPETNRSTLGVVGEKDVVYAFRVIGLEARAAETPEEIGKAVFKLVRSGIRIILITESAARKVPDIIEKYKSDPEVALIPIPGSNGTDGYGMAQVHANVEKAIGTDILKNSEN